MRIRFTKEWVDEKHLGWLSINKFECEGVMSLSDVLRSYEFTDEFIRLSNNKFTTSKELERRKQVLGDCRYALSLAKLDKCDYEVVSCDVLLQKFIEYGNTEWGEDISFYRRAIILIIDNLPRPNELELYYLNIESVKNKEIFSSERQFYSYYINIVVLDNTGKSVLIIDLGGD